MVADRTSASSNSTVTLTVIPDSGYVLNALIVADRQGNEMKLTERGSGKYTFTMPGRAVTVKATFAPLPGDVQGSCNGGADCPSRGFSALGSVGRWYHEAVDYVLEHELMTGYRSGIFGPNDTLSRAQLAQILYNREGKPSAVSGSASTSTAFTDVASGAWYGPAVTWAAERGIVSGYGDGRFGPNDNITRQRLGHGCPVLGRREQHHQRQRWRDTRSQRQGDPCRGRSHESDGKMDNLRKRNFPQQLLPATQIFLSPDQTREPVQSPAIKLNFQNPKAICRRLCYYTSIIGYRRRSDPEADCPKPKKATTSKPKKVTKMTKREITEQEMWEAVMKNDASYDGVFFYAVKTTGIYCRPSCKSKPPRRENICFFSTAKEARAAGFRPCKRCRSDLPDYHPMKEIAKTVKEAIDRAFIEQEKCNRGLTEIGLSSRRVADVFKAEYGITPKTYADSLRLKEAQRLLLATDAKVIDIAYQAGFGSLTAFYSFFRKETGTTPGEYRKGGQEA